MLIIAGGRRSGKTYRLAQMMKDNPYAVMLEPNAAMIRYVEQDYPHLRGRILSANNRERLLGIDSDLYIDNIDILLWDYLGQRPAVVTATGMTDDLTAIPAYMRVSEGL